MRDALEHIAVLCIGVFGVVMTAVLSLALAAWLLHFVGIVLT